VQVAHGRHAVAQEERQRPIGDVNVCIDQPWDERAARAIDLPSDGSPPSNVSRSNRDDAAVTNGDGAARRNAAIAVHDARVANEELDRGRWRGNEERRRYQKGASH
jgi:hypothetical protein